MSETPWTKGKWEFVDDHPNRSCLRIKSGWHEVATLYYADEDGKSEDESGVYREDHQRVANARLISCAPEMYEALDQLLRAHHHSSGDEYVDAARAILLKARGETKDP